VNDLGNIGIFFIQYFYLYQMKRVISKNLIIKAKF